MLTSPSLSSLKFHFTLLKNTDKPGSGSQWTNHFKGIFVLPILADICCVNHRESPNPTVKIAIVRVTWPSSSKHHRLLSMLLVPLLKQMVRPYCSDSTCMSHQTWRSWAAAQVQVLSVLSSNYGARRCSGHYQKGKVIINITQMQTLRPTTTTCLWCNSSTVLGE